MNSCLYRKAGLVQGALLKVLPRVVRCRSMSTATHGPGELIHVDAPNQRDFSVNSIWLRHHCQCEECQNHVTHQRINIPTSSLLSNSKVSRSNIVEDNLLQVFWNDDHVSEYDITWLTTHAPAKSPSSNLLPQMNDNWVGLSKKDVDIIYRGICGPPKNPLDASISFSNFMDKGTNGVYTLLKNVRKFGYGIVMDCPPNFETTKEVVLKVSHVQNTIFGDFSEWTSNLAHKDTAYTADEVYLHTDTSYFTEPMGLQIFHCLKHEGTGGVNSIVDGFQVARKIALEKPELYGLLSSVDVECQYVDPGKHEFRSNGSIFSHDSIKNRIQRIRYNPHDMGILSHVPYEKVGKFYEGLILLSELLQEKPQFIKLTPGLVIFLDNWRTLHGRTSFTGFRHLCGAYISRSDWLSKARVLGLTED